MTLFLFSVCSSMFVFRCLSGCHNFCLFVMTFVWLSKLLSVCHNFCLFVCISLSLFFNDFASMDRLSCLTIIKHWDHIKLKRYYNPNCNIVSISYHQGCGTVSSYSSFDRSFFQFNPSKHGGGGGALYAPPSLAFCLLLKISWGNPYLKILDLANLFVADAPMKNKSRNLVLPPSQNTLKYGSENRP